MFFRISNILIYLMLNPVHIYIYIYIYVCVCVCVCVCVYERCLWCYAHRYIYIYIKPGLSKMQPTNFFSMARGGTILVINVFLKLANVFLASDHVS